jgi:hypothetical protein
MANNTRAATNKRTAACLEIEAKEVIANYDAVVGELTSVCHHVWGVRKFRYAESRKFSQLMLMGVNLFKEIPDDDSYAGRAELDYVISGQTIREHMKNWHFSNTK